MPFEGVEVQGLRDFYRALGTLERGTQAALRQGLLEGAEPVRVRAQSLAASQIRNMTSDWSKMKVGATAAALVYVAPKARRKGGSKRPNLAGLLMKRAMRPALRQKQHEVERAVARAMSKAIHRAGL
jgi:hypothetical protein